MNHVYLLGCDEFPERKAATQAHLRERGVLAKYWRSIHGKSWGLETLHEYDAGKRIPPGHVGLNLGVWNLWQHLYLTVPDDPGENVIVFEDDVVLPPAWHAELFTLRLQLDKHLPDWQLVFLGVAETEPNCWGKITERLGGPDTRLCRMDCPFGTHALMLRPSALPVLLDNMAIAQRNLDQQLWERVLSKNLLRWCAVLPSLVRQRTYDHDLTGRPEWAPSTLDANRPDTPDRVAVERERDRLEQRVRNARRDGDGDDTPGKPSARTYNATAPFIDPYPCIYRGEYTETHGSYGDGRATVPLSVCSRLERPCHSKPARNGDVLVFEGGAGRNAHRVRDFAIACETCHHRLGMRAPERARDRLPLPEGHFNPSVIEYRGDLILASRDSWGHSRVGLWRLRNTRDDWTGAWTCLPVASLASDHPDAPRLEDPRLFVHEGRLHAVFNLPDGYPPKRVRVGYVRFSENLDRIESTTVFPSPYGNLYEKNWVPFVAGGGLHWVYQSSPQHEVVNDQGDWWRTDNPLPWTGGVVRGGAAPVRVHNGATRRDEFLHVFHGCLKRVQGSVYTVGALYFDAEPPFRVLRQTRKPLMFPDLPAPGEDTVKRYVLWPGGAVVHGGNLFLALGVDDTFCRIASIPMRDVDAAMNADPGAGESPVTIRNTPLARGSTS